MKKIIIALLLLALGSGVGGYIWGIDKGEGSLFEVRAESGRIMERLRDVGNGRSCDTQNWWTERKVSNALRVELSMCRAERDEFKRRYREHLPDKQGAEEKCR